MPSLRSICVGLLMTPLHQFSSATRIIVEPSTSRNPTLPHDVVLPGIDLNFRYALIGRGTQNYTCATACGPAVPVGAVATLFDATALARLSPSMLHTIPPLAVDQPIPAAGEAFQVGTAPPLMPIGRHYFDAAGVPVFELSGVNKVLYATRAANVSAPEGSNPGAGGRGHGAVDWLLLVAKQNYVAESVGLGAAYRVVTAGGKAVCDREGAQQVDYAAEYWFYA
ncbi:uncharacterized protein L3040_005648 [Drepanopeziza brunnea f. sp. 'multigermtubi']|uniref:Malate dehydrogenase n=1 Tax=Marssonina brunnea f. sp. multigermtubi (strain MB_m1) TaxID=1072389 RepID=K1WLK7_MARBU|nr:uncharacterized protein MBM_07937 [Drepanopeziza brunnea f. sp. 'multigermtubi' MB_m1]EKD13736.1 hypothetical protein MBM_07937 [Drepanopeziza brunnea f. sp. 'multigermtubi' MB_m1]KAJ5041094.1 hypothetical protein L3040_005648 [Drepanopeziza brunnea f. sp. 'multigermtubi']